MILNNIVNRYSIAGLSATLIGNGIGRFAYIALMPALIQSGWFSHQDASYLGAATLIGYIFGAPLASMLVGKLSVSFLIRTAMIISCISYFGCAFEDAPIEVFYVLRTMAGLAGAMLMVLAPPAIIKLHPAKRKSRVSGVVFFGIGLGAMLSGTLVPLLVYFSLQAAWIGMGVIALIAIIISWDTWGKTDNVALGDVSDDGVHHDSFKKMSTQQKTAVFLILSAYTLNAIGYLPHTLFWVDYIARELHYSLFEAGLFWATFGIGAAIGSLFTGYLGDHIGVKRSLVLAFSLKSIAVALPLVSSNPVSLFFSSLIVGVFTPGTVTLISTYTLEAVGYKLHTKAWGLMTLFFAISQGVVGFIMASYTAHSISYKPLFFVSSSVLVISVICIALSNTEQSRQRVMKTA